MIESKSGAPATYEELFEHYWGFICSLVAKAGINEVEDVASEILTRFIERDALSWYDPEMKHDVGDTPRLPGQRMRSARFSGFLRSFVCTYVMQHRDRQNTRAVKEPVRCEQPAGENGATWIDVHAPIVEAVSHNEWSAEGIEEVRTARSHLASLPVRGRRDLARAYDMCLEMYYCDGAIDRSKIAATFGVSDTAVCQIFKDLRNELAGIGLTPAGSRRGAAVA